MKTAVVTGVAQGIGYHIALGLKNLGLDVYGVVRPGRVAGLGIKKIELDLESNLEIFEQVLDVVPRCNILINNAGLLINKSFEDQSLEEVEKSLSVNFLAVWKIVKVLLPKIPPCSHIVNIGSMGGFQGSQKFAGLSSYSAAKAALANLTETLSLELKSRQIAVNCLALGSVQTSMFEAAFPNQTACMNAESVGAEIARFAMEGNRFYNGKILPMTISTP